MARRVEKVEKCEERSRLKKLAISRNILSEAPSKPHSSLRPTKPILKHDGRDIVKKSQRKNKFLFSFPGLFAPISGGKMGEFKDLGTKNPILYLDFPQGQMKLFGTIVYPKNLYLTLQFSKGGGKSIICEDTFDNMIVFSDAWWIGRKDENPEELRLELPKHLTEGKHTDYDFKGGAGSTTEQKPGFHKPEKERVQNGRQSTLAPEDDASDDSTPLTAENKDVVEITPVRHSARTAGKTFKYVDASSGDDSVGTGSDTSELMENTVEEKLDDDMVTASDGSKMDDSSDGINNVDIAESGLQEKSSFIVRSKEVSIRKRGPLVQATLSSLFEKVEEKPTGCVRRSLLPKETAQKSTGTKRKIDQLKNEEPIQKGAPMKQQKSGTKSTKKKRQSKAEDDDIEEFSSESEDIDGSDEDWTVM